MNNGKSLMQLETVVLKNLDIISVHVRCGKEYFGFNSCRNRHCPMCQNYAREKWIQKEAKLSTRY